MANFHINIRYQFAKRELDYIAHCIEFIEGNIEPKVSLLNEEHEQIIKKLYDININEEVENDEVKLLLANEYFQAENFHYESISKTIMESVFIRQIATVEKFLVDLSFDVYQFSQGDGKHLVPPNYIKTDKRRFSDSIASVNSINNNLSIDIKNITEWKIFKAFRNFRHKLAHGVTYFEARNEVIKDYNKKFKTDIITFHSKIYILQEDPNYKKHLEIINIQETNKLKYGESVFNTESSYYKINPDFKSFIQFNNYLLSFIEQVRTMVESQDFDMKNKA